MHEYTIVKSMIELCEKYSKGKEIKKVSVNIGKLSGIEPHFLSDSFDVFKEDSVCKDAILDMNIIDIRIECQNCKKEALIENYDFHCPFCKSGDTKIISGEEMHIEYIELKE